MTTPTVGYKNHRFPPSTIAHAVWLYFRFPLSLRLVEEMLLERGKRSGDGGEHSDQPTQSNSVAGDLRVTASGTWTRS